MFYILSIIAAVTSMLILGIILVVGLLDFILSKFHKIRLFTAKEFWKVMKICLLILLISSVYALGCKDLLYTVTPIKTTVQEEITDFGNLLIEKSVSIEISDDDTFKVIKTTTYTKYDEPRWKEIILAPLLSDSSSITYTLYVPQKFVN